MSSTIPTNELIQSTSPYLLQHAHNPVNWKQWSDRAFEEAVAMDKLVLISVGYSACHWCHVMEKESFEDIEVAEIMNNNFVCIKVDREERPDVDMVYMKAVQALSGRGGWPLNCFALPDGKPVYGGTYYPKENWKELLINLSSAYKKDKNKIRDYGSYLTEQLQITRNTSANTEFKKEDLKQLAENWKNDFDSVNGGYSWAPKFPMPNNFSCLLKLGHLLKDNELSEHVFLTLNKIAAGGIYDHLGGGFTRYSTDAIWKVPHFEKMLFDNAQLIQLYSDAFKLSANPAYKEVVYETHSFIREVLTSAEGGLYAALDADSEGVEGKYYTWTIDELKEILKNDYTDFANYYNINSNGYWEHDQYIPLRTNMDYNQDKAFNEKINNLKSRVKSIRNNRIPPQLDDKIITSWNALACEGYCHAYQAFEDAVFLDKAKEIMHFILKKLMTDDYHVYRCITKGKTDVNGFLDDYVFTCKALITLYQVTFEEQYLTRSKNLLLSLLEKFPQDDNGLCDYITREEQSIFLREKEIHDQVIPASNSVLAQVLFLMSKYYDNQVWDLRAQKMLLQVNETMKSHPSSFSNWISLQSDYLFPFYEVSISGNNVENVRKHIQKKYLPNMLISEIQEPTEITMNREKSISEIDQIHICYDKTCLAPTDNVENAVNLLHDL